MFLVGLHFLIQKNETCTMGFHSCIPSITDPTKHDNDSSYYICFMQTNKEFLDDS